MQLDNILDPSGVVHRLEAGCKREVLQILAGHAQTLTGIPAPDIMQTLLEREQLGSTAVGRGIAVPHGKVCGLPGITGILAQLQTPVDFDATDGQPVDIVFLLLAPENARAAHLKALAKVSHFLRDPGTCDALRCAGSAEALFAIAASTGERQAALLVNER